MRKRDQHQGDKFLANAHRLRIGKDRGGKDCEAGLEKFGRLQGEPAEIDPAFRAQHFIAGEQHQRRTDHRKREHDRRDKLDGADREHRGNGKNATRQSTAKTICLAA